MKNTSIITMVIIALMAFISCGDKVPNGKAFLMNVDVIKAEAGIATAVLQIGDVVGAINISADSKGLVGEF